MSDATHRGGSVPGKTIGNDVRYYQRDFWSQENLKFSEPHYRMGKAVQIISRVAAGRESELLDIGCGPATLRRVLPSNINYHGIDIAIQNPAPDLIESDIVNTPIRFADKKFDIVIAQGVFEYVPNVQAQKFAEIAEILRPTGTFIVTYWNYAHRNPKIYHAHTNVQPIGEFRQDLSRCFRVDRYFPASHNWYHGSPSMSFNKTINMHVNMRIPLVSRLLGVEYFFLCSPPG